MRILICGNFGHRTHQSDGQTYRTRLLHEEFCHYLPEDDIMKVDTSYITRHPIQVLSGLKRAFLSSDLLVMMPGKKGLQLFSFLFSRWRKSNPIPIHYLVIGGWLPEYLEKFRRIKVFCSNINGVYVQTNHMADKLIKAGIPNAVVLPNFRKFDREALVQSNQASLKEPLKACFYSRIIHEKGIELAMTAVERVNTALDRKAVSLDIYGPVPRHYRQPFETLLNRYPDQPYQGPLPPENPYQVLCRYDVMLFPTFYEGEGFPGAVLDSFIAGVPVIASDWRYNGEVINDGITGLLFRTGRVEELEEKIRQLLEDRELLVALKRHAAEYAEQYHTDQVIPRLISHMGIGR